MKVASHAELPLRALLTALIIAGGISLSRAAPAPGAAHWPDTFVARLEAEALLQSLNGEILASRSATRTLESWCKSHDLATDARLVARPLPDASRAPSAEQLQRLQVGAADEVKYRRVQLRCGDHLLSEAENWYVPARLTPDMNRVLTTTETPFGRAVEALQPWRQTIGATILWSPLPERWESARGRLPSSRGSLPIPEALFEHRALLYTRDHLPFAEVVEVYQRDLLAFPAPTLH